MAYNTPANVDVVSIVFIFHFSIASTCCYLPSADKTKDRVEGLMARRIDVILGTGIIIATLCYRDRQVIEPTDALTAQINMRCCLVTL